LASLRLALRLRLSAPTRRSSDLHVIIEGPTKIGADNGFFPFSSIGTAPQDLSYAGEPTRLEIGDHNKIREFVTINRGTVKGGGLDRKSTRLNSSHGSISYAVFCL